MTADLYEGTPFKALEIDGLPKDWQPSTDDRSTRLAAVVSTWNVIQHFYPYFDVIDADWNEELARALASSASDNGESEHYETLEHLVAAVSDGHGSVSRMSVFVPPPVKFDSVGESIVVTAIGQGVDERLQVGDVLTSIDGQSIETIIASLSKRISAATPGYLRFRILSRLGYGISGSTLAIRARSPEGEEREITLKRDIASISSRPLHESRPKQGSYVA